jgi:hypothetical protein
VDADLYTKVRDGEVARIGSGGFLDKAARLLDDLVLGDQLQDFLTTSAYEHLD